MKLAEDWCLAESPAVACGCDYHQLAAELATELHPAHPLFGRALTVVAHRFANDDILCAHDAEPGRYSVVHLSWSQRSEFDEFPTVDFDGSWAAFLTSERVSEPEPVQQGRQLGLGGTQLS
jgi:hypothetical protein